MTTAATAPGGALGAEACVADGGLDPDADVGAALGRLRAAIGRRSGLVVAFSGGADSALLAWVATDVLGAARVRCATAVSASLAASELDDCRALADEWGLSWEPVATHELEDPAYRANDGDRCYWCKQALSDALAPVAARLTAELSDAPAAEATAPAPAPGSVAVALGVNLDDLSDHRPGQRAAAERGAWFPLVEAGFTKAMVRAASHALGLRTAAKPAAPCLASRVPYGVPVTLGVLREVEQAEAALRRLGFDELRVRHQRGTARIEVPSDRVAELVARGPEVASAVRAAGFEAVTVDLDGLRSGNLNRALRGGERAMRVRTMPL